MCLMYKTLCLNLLSIHALDIASEYYNYFDNGRWRFIDGPTIVAQCNIYNKMYMAKVQLVIYEKSVVKDKKEFQNCGLHE